MPIKIFMQFNDNIFHLKPNLTPKVNIKFQEKKQIRVKNQFHNNPILYSMYSVMHSKNKSCSSCGR